MSPGEDLELRVVEGQPAAEVLDLARDDDLGADGQASLDEAAAEPGRVDAAGLVLEPRDRPLDAAPEARLDPDVADRGLDRDDRAVLFHEQVAQLSHLAQVVIPPRQVEKQVPDVVEAELDPGPPQERPGGETRARQRGREQLDRIGRDAVPGSSPSPPYSAEMRYR